MAKTAQAVIETKVKDGASAGFRKVDKAMQNTAKQGKVLNQQLRFMRGGFGQVGHQIQDVAVQLQMGQNAMLVFGQQGSQIASLFGPGGAMIGAVLAVGAAISMALMPKFFGATQAAKDLKEEMKGLSGSFDTLTTAQKAIVVKEFTQKIEDNNEIIKANEEKLKNLRAQLELVNSQNKKTAEQQDNTNGKLLSYIGIAPGVIRANVEQANSGDALTDTINLLQGQVDTANAKNVEYQKTIDNTTTAFEKQRDSLNKQIDTFGKTGHALRLVGIEADLAAGKIKDGEAKKLIALSLSLAKLEENAEREIQITQEVADAQRKAQQEAEKAIRDKERAAQRFADGFARSFTNAITTADNFKDAMKGVAKSVVDSLMQMIVQKQIADAIFNIIPASLGGGGGGGTQTATATATATASTGSALTNLTNQAFGSTVTSPFTSIQPRANGGLVTKGRPYMVGERGHELFVPNESGNIIPNNKLDGGSVTINQTINISTGVQQTVRAEIANLMPKIADATKNAVAESRMRGGSFSKSLVGG